MIKNGSFTTHDSSQPDFHLNAQSVRIYQNDRVVFKNVTFYVGQTPIFWWPYLYQSLDRSFSYHRARPILSSWGPSLLGQVSFPDHRENRDASSTGLPLSPGHGARVRLRNSLRKGQARAGRESPLTICSDENPDINRTSAASGGTPTSRYRFSIQNRTNFTDTSRGTVKITKLSDEFLLQDFYPGEFQLDPQPDNVVAVTKTNPFYTLTAISRFQANDFYRSH